MELDLVPTEDLLKALQARFDCVVFAGVQLSGKAIDDTIRTWQGNPYMCMGLCHSLAADIEHMSSAEEE